MSHRYRHAKLSLLGNLLLGNLLLILVSAPGIAGDCTPQEELISFKLKDQFDRLHTDGRFRNAVLVVTWGDRRGSEYLENWDPALSDSLAAEIAGYRVRRLRVAHTKGAPFFVKGMIKDKMAKDPDRWTLLDWDGVFDQAYCCVEERANILVFDGGGRLINRWSASEADPVLLEEILAEVRILVAR